MPRVLPGRTICSIVLLCSSLLTSLPAHSQPFAAPVAQDAKARYSLSGTVVNSLTNEPVRRALVHIYLGKQHGALTDANGRFEFNNLPMGSSSIDVRKPGFFAEQQLAPSSGLSQMITVGPDLQPIVVKLVPEAVIFGHIQTVDGSPIEGVRVGLLSQRINEGRKEWQADKFASTNEDGEFRIADLTPGLYYLEAGPGRERRELDPLKAAASSLPATFYPGTTDLRSAAPLEVGPGQQVNADLSIRTAPFFKISGSISGASSQTGVNLEILDHLGNSVSWGNRFDPSTGEFQASAPAGSYTILAMAYVPDGLALHASVDVNLTSDVSGVKLILAPDYPIPVHVRREATHPSNQLSSGRGADSFPMLRLTNVTGMVTQRYRVSFEHDTNGQAMVRNLLPGTYSAEVTAYRPWYVQSAQCGDVDLLREELTVTPGVQTPPIEVTLRDDGASVGVKMNKASPQARVTVLVVPDGGPPVRAVTFNGDGTVLIDSLAPGGYNLFAFDHANGLEYRNPQALQPYSSKAVHVTLQPNDQQQIELQLIKLSD